MEHAERLRRELVDANHILAAEDVLDAFGHVSARDPERPEEYLLSRAVSPESVSMPDILRFTLDSKPVDPNAPRSYSERVIHGCLYELRPDINAVCHFHAQSIVPFCATDTPLVPVTHVGATIGVRVPVWSSQEAFGDTNLLVVSQEEGLSLARAMGDGWTLLMTHHGGVVAGRSIREAVFRAIQLCRNAEAQIRAMQIGRLKPLTEREVEMAGAFNLGEPVLERAWNCWKKRLHGQPMAAAAE